MKEGIKIVDKYQLLQEKVQIKDGIKIIPARHTVEDKIYSLKKIKLSDENKNKYTALLNQINIIKQIRYKRVIMCHQILKTNTSLYVSYDYMSENTLQSFIESHRVTLSYNEKLKLATKMANFFLFLKTNNIVNLNIKPSNIQVFNFQDKKQIEIRFNNFQYAIEITKPISETIVKNVPVSEFLPLQFFANEVHINHSCSIYVLGKLFEFMQLNNQNKNDKDSVNSSFKQILTLLNNTIQKMITKQQNKRPAIEQIIELFSKIQNKQSFSNTMKNQKSMHKLFLSVRSNQNLRIAKTKSFQVVSSRSKSNLKQIERQNYEECGKKINQYCLMIIKSRNLSLFLLKCCEAFLKLDFVEVDTIVQISFLFLKKSTGIMNQLYRLMEKGKHKQIIISSKQFDFFSKSTDFFRLQTIIAKDLNYSKNYLGQMLVSIYQNHTNLLQCSEFKKETRSEDIQNSFMKLKTIEFLKTVIENSRLKSISKDSLKYFYILAYLINFDSFQELFNQLINQQILQLERQTLLINAGQMDYEALQLKLHQLDKFLEEKNS